ncbi:hypothetical protein WMW72_18550 [Paenibacillus filicis]|uniref:Replication-associated protein ORF2/G2P domain-containing protein n=1 Tax=Paenibacillus filicis TaxID=669464 RepID=A0ABU9DM20_9BACL
MGGYNCQMVRIGDYVRVKRYGRKIYPAGMNPRLTKAQREAARAAIRADPKLSAMEKLLRSAIYEPVGEEEQPKKHRERMPRPGRLTLAEREKFCHLMDLNFRPGDKFITLTYERTDITLEEGGRDFENWVKRMREWYGDFKYLAVRSFQKRGTLHFHVLANLPRLPEQVLKDQTFQALWGQGRVDYRTIYGLPMEERRNRLKQDMLNNLRVFKEDERSYGKRLLLQSKNLIQPTRMKGDYDEMMKDLRSHGYQPYLVESRRFPAEYLDYMELETYRLSSSQTE